MLIHYVIFTMFLKSEIIVYIRNIDFFAAKSIFHMRILLEKKAKFLANFDDLSLFCHDKNSINIIYRKSQNRLKYIRNNFNFLNYILDIYIWYFQKCYCIIFQTIILNNKILLNFMILYRIIFFLFFLVFSF